MFSDYVSGCELSLGLPLRLGIQQTLQGRIADAQFSGCFSPGDPSSSYEFQYFGEPLLKLGPFTDLGPAYLLAPLTGPIHSGQHQVSVELLPGRILIPDRIPSQGPRYYCGFDSLRWPSARRIRVRVGKRCRQRARCHLNPQFGRQWWRVLGSQQLIPMPY